MKASQLSNRLDFAEAEPWVAEGDTIVTQFAGRPASQGTAAGRCRIVSSVEDLSTIEKDTILFFDHASPVLSMVMPRLAGLVTRHGGPLAIAAGYARLYGIPAVVGVGNFMDSVRDGDYVLVDGSAGRVDVLRGPA